MLPDPKTTLSHATDRAWTLFDEFKAFAFKGNVIDLAIGVIIGGAFGTIVKSLVDNIIMPPVGVILPGQQGYQGWVLTIDGKRIPHGKFLGDVVNFLIIALALFVIVVKILGWFMKIRKDKPPPLTKDQQLLAEIRDLLKSQVQGEGGDVTRPTAPDQPI